MQHQQEGQLVLDAGQAAELLGVSRRKLLTMVRENEVPCIRIGRFVKFRRATLEDWIVLQEARSRRGVSA